MTALPCFPGKIEIRSPINGSAFTEKKSYRVYSAAIFSSSYRTDDSKIMESHTGFLVKDDNGIPTWLKMDAVKIVDE